MILPQTMGRPRHPDTVMHRFRGVDISLYPNVRGTWEAGFTIPGRSRDKATGPTERDCREAACGKIAALLDPDALAVWNDEESAKRILAEFGVTLTEAARFYASQHSIPIIKATVREVRDAWLKRIRERKRKKQYHHHRSSAQRTERFVARFGDRQISSITSVELIHFQDELESAVGSRTVRNIYDATKSLFRYARERGYLAPDRLSAAEQVKRPTAEPGKKGIFTVEEMQALLDAAWGYAMPGAFAMATVAFGSNRSEELCKQDADAPLEHRLCWEDFRWNGKRYVDIRLEVAKTWEPRKAGLPSNLARMLMPHRASGPLYSGRRLDLAYAAIAAKAGVTWKCNGLRHSCLTYDVLLAHNATEVALRSGNSIAMIEAHYLNTSATKEQALQWFSLRPRIPWGSLLKSGK